MSYIFAEPEAPEVTIKNISSDTVILDLQTQPSLFKLSCLVMDHNNIITTCKGNSSIGYECQVVILIIYIVYLNYMSSDRSSQYHHYMQGKQFYWI